MREIVARAGVGGHGRVRVALVRIGRRDRRAVRRIGDGDAGNGVRTTPIGDPAWRWGLDVWYGFDESGAGGGGRADATCVRRCGCESVPMQCDGATWPLGFTPVIVRAGRYPLNDRAFDVSYRHPTRALHLHEVSGILRRESSEEPFSAGDLVLSLEGVATTYALSRFERVWCVHFMPADAAGPAVALPWAVALGPLRSYVAERMARMSRMQAMAARDVTAGAQASAILLEVIMLMAHHAQPTSRRAPRATDEAVAQAAHHLEIHACEAVDVPRIAAKVGLPQHRLARCFRERYGMTMQRYHLAARIDLARHDLVHTDMSLDALARRLGFGDIQHFTKRFTRVIGMAPGRYRAIEAAAT